MNKNKKGFTIVELVIVIAVLALLVAILIPTFTDLIRKANLTKDTQLCRILNEDIGMGVTDEKLQEHATFNDVIEYLAPRYTLQNLTPTSNGDIVWDQNTNTFSLIENGKFVYVGSSKTEKNYNPNGVNLNMWQVVSSIPATENQKYSLYLKTNANIPTVNVVVGFDAGTNNNVTAVNYDRSGVENPTPQTVVIRTNSYLTTLTINAPLDIVKHYDKAGNVNIISSDSASYHENGSVPFMEVAGGHVVLESESDVSAIHFTATGTGSSAKFENADNKKISIDLSKVQEENTPTFTRDAVEIAENGTYVAEVKTDKTEHVWLFGNGIKEQMVVTETTGAIAENGTLKQDITAGAEDGSVAEQIANPAKRNEQGELVDENNEVIDVTSVNWNESDALEEVTAIVYEELMTKEEAQEANDEPIIEAIEESGKYVARIGATGYTTFNEGWAAAPNKTLVILKDITLNALQISGAYNIDLGTHTMTLRGHANAGTTGGAIYIDGGRNWTHGNLVIENGTLNMTGANFSTYGIYNYGTLTLKDLTINSNCNTDIYVNGQQEGTAGTTLLDNVELNSTKSGSTAFASYSYKSYFYGTVSPTVTIKNSTITAKYNAVMIYATPATIEDCNISAENNNVLWISRSANASGVTATMNVKGNVTLNGGSDYKKLNAQNDNSIAITAGIYNINPTSYVDTNNYTVTDNGNGTWTVTAIA